LPPRSPSFLPANTFLIQRMARPMATASSYPQAAATEVRAKLRKSVGESSF
jgi:hypothetical protein